MCNVMRAVGVGGGARGGMGVHGTGVGLHQSRRSMVPMRVTGASGPAFLASRWPRRLGSCMMRTNPGRFDRMQGFLSYAHDDHECFEDFSAHLKALKRAFNIGVWTDHQILAGTVWQDAIARAIATAEVFVLMVSPKFIESGYVFNVEIPAIRDRRHSANALVLPVVVKRCAWQLVASSLQAVPTERRRVKPVADWRPMANGFDQARAEIQAAIAEHFGLTPRTVVW
jgi:TIR domain